MTKSYNKSRMNTDAFLSLNPSVRQAIDFGRKLRKLIRAIFSYIFSFDFF
jgi:hypothetical protein